MNLDSAFPERVLMHYNKQRITLFENHKFEKIALFQCINDSECHAPLRLCEMTPQICYHSNYGITNW